MRDKIELTELDGHSIRCIQDFFAEGEKHRELFEMISPSLSGMPKMKYLITEEEAISVALTILSSLFRRPDIIASSPVLTLVVAAAHALATQRGMPGQEELERELSKSWEESIRGG